MSKPQKEKQEILATSEIFVDASVVNQMCLLCEKDKDKVCLMIISNHFKKTEIVTAPKAKKYIVRNIDTQAVLVFTDSYFYCC